MFLEALTSSHWPICTFFSRCTSVSRCPPSHGIKIRRPGGLDLDPYLRNKQRICVCLRLVGCLDGLKACWTGDRESFRLIKRHPASRHDPALGPSCRSEGHVILKLQQTSWERVEIQKRAVSSAQKATTSSVRNTRPQRARWNQKIGAKAGLGVGAVATCS